MGEILDTIYESILDGEIRLVPSQVQTALNENLVTMMMEGCGFEVIDLGIDQSADDFVEAIRGHRQPILNQAWWVSVLCRQRLCPTWKL